MSEGEHEARNPDQESFATGGQMRGVECARCGLTPFDLPDGVDPELVFDVAPDGRWYDQGCLTTVDTWPDHGRVLDPWSDRIRDARH